MSQTKGSEEGNDTSFDNGKKEPLCPADPAIELRLHKFGQVESLHGQGQKRAGLARKAATKKYYLYIQ